MLKSLLMSDCVMPFCMEEESGGVADSGAGGSAADSGDDEQNAGGSADDSPAKSGDNPPEIYRPDGLPDHYAGENNHATIDNLFKAVEGYRKSAPKTADEYTFEEPEELKGKLLRLNDDGKDPILEKFKPIAHKHGMTNEAFRDVALELSKSLMELGGNGNEVDDSADFEYESYGGAEAAKPVVDGVTVWAQGLKNQGKLSDADVEEISLAVQYDQGLNVWNKVREMTGEKPIPKGDGAPGGKVQITEEMLNARVSDPRYIAGTREFDPAFYKETTEMFQELYNNT